ncbi:MAG: hypothetical protein KW802_02110 [Candidatus Doudnabacteria bacterium]|nr:hypothetical protein [Candidatus Doudnabacteria bacterium]
MNILNKFWEWYNRRYLVALSVTTFLFLLQLFHLYWLFTDVILLKLAHRSYFAFPPIWGAVSTVLDYTEIPALISTSLVYINQMRLTGHRKNLWYLLALNIQWLHLFWITDQVVIEHLGQHSFFHWANLVAWVAILIDYAELPVMYDTAKKTVFEFSAFFRKDN